MSILETRAYQVRFFFIVGDLYPIQTYSPYNLSPSSLLLLKRTLDPSTHQMTMHVLPIQATIVKQPLAHSSIRQVPTRQEQLDINEKPFPKHT